jgi:hypothetical protein
VLQTAAGQAAFFKISKIFIVCLQHNWKKPQHLMGKGGV